MHAEPSAQIGRVYRLSTERNQAQLLKAAMASIVFFVCTSVAYSAYGEDELAEDAEEETARLRKLRFLDRIPKRRARKELGSKGRPARTLDPSWIVISLSH